MAGSKESHQLIHEILFTETTALQGYAQNINICKFAFFELVFLGSDELSASSSDDCCGSFDLTVSLDWEVAYEPTRKEYIEGRGWQLVWTA